MFIGSGILLVAGIAGMVFGKNCEASLFRRMIPFFVLSIAAGIGLIAYTNIGAPFIWITNGVTMFSFFSLLFGLTGRNSSD